MKDWANFEYATENLWPINFLDELVYKLWRFWFGNSFSLNSPLVLELYAYRFYEYFILSSLVVNSSSSTIKNFRAKESFNPLLMELL